MNILYGIFLNMIFVSYVRSDLLPGVVCVCLGTHVDIKRANPTITLSDIPERCKVVIVGEDFFNEDPSKEDDTTIAALKAAGKTVYMMYGGPEDQEWGSIISDPKKLDACIVPMLTYLKKNNIEGVILSYLKINYGVIPDYASKIKTLICKIKECVPSIKVGLHLIGADSYHYSNKRIFDFTVTNPTVDFYVVDLWTSGADCKPDLNKLGGRLPVTSDDTTVITLEEVCKDIANSPLDKSKLVVYIYDIPTVMDSNSIRSYSDYCCRTDDEVWCADTSQILYDRVIYLKNNNFKGLMFSYLELDDMTNACGCGKFPVANTYIDAWEGKPLTSCPKLC